MSLFKDKVLLNVNKVEPYKRNVLLNKFVCFMDKNKDCSYNSHPSRSLGYSITSEEDANNNKLNSKPKIKNLRGKYLGRG